MQPCFFNVFYPQTFLMRKLFLSILICVLSVVSFAQRNETVVKLVDEGIALHDKGDFENAIKKYDEALKIDANDFDANYEKSLTLLYAKRYKECIELSKTIIDKFPKNESLMQVYSNWGSALDDDGQSKEALKIYAKGIKQYPEHYLLHFNKGLTHMRLEQYDEAVESYQLALKNNPLHASSNYYTAAIIKNENRIPALLAYATFIAIEPESERSKKAYEAIQEIVYRGIKKEGNNTTISVSMDMLDPKKKKKEDDFSGIELIFSLLGIDNVSKADSLAKTAADKFDLKLQLLIDALEEQVKTGKGFYWEHYVPFFIEMKKKNYTSVLSNLIYYSAENDSKVWANLNGEKLKEFYDWLENYQWK